MANRSIPVIDLFSGPGGLSEGFSRFGERDWSGQLSRVAAGSLPESQKCFASDARFRIALSIEKDFFAHKTLELRAFYREFERAELPAAFYEHLRGAVTREALFSKYPTQASAAAAEAWHNALGSEGVPEAVVDSRIRKALAGRDEWVLIGGPPCQAYSLVGRSRRAGIKSYRPEKDERHFLYREYLRIVAKHEPPVFVMENVKGLLSSKVEGVGMFQTILDDLSSPGRDVPGASRRLRYQLHPLAPHSSEALYGEHAPTDYVLRMERHGIPQARHRVILLGIREDIARRSPLTLPERQKVTVSEVIDDLPKLRGGVTRLRDDGPVVVDTLEAWQGVLRDAVDSRWFREIERFEHGAEVRQQIERAVDKIRTRVTRGDEYVEHSDSSAYAPAWFNDRRLGGVCNHHARAHLASDLHRYLFAACYSQAVTGTATLKDFPKSLLPNHSSATVAVATGGNFGDRFRVQRGNYPATTVTSHIRKDGHYYIHPDPTQCRSLTVREAARLQTFPDNYLFCGNRTEQYQQVGNAVPPLLAVQIAGVVADFMAPSRNNR